MFSVLSFQLGHKVDVAEGSANLHVHFSSAKCTPVVSTGHRLTNASALAQVARQDRDPLDNVLVSL